MYKFFLYYFEDLEDQRDATKVEHDLYEIVFIAFISTLCGVDGFTDMEMFAQYQKDWFLKYIKLKNGVPSHDTMMRVLNMLDPKDFSERFSKLFKTILSYSGVDKGIEQYSIDGKSIKGSVYIDKETGKKRMLHTLNVLSNSSGLSIFQRTVCKDKVKSETEAILEALSFLDIKKKVISVDAGISYRHIADKIIEKKGDYVMSIKENNKKTLNIIKDFYSSGYSKENRFEEEENAHGRKTKRVFYAYKLPKKERDLVDFTKVNYVGIYETFDLKKNELSDRRYYITSKNITGPEEFYRYCRNHWGVENKLHWMLDVLFKEDDSKFKKGNAPKIILILRQLGLNLLKMDTSKGTFKSKKRKFEWNNQYRDKMLERDIKGWIIKK